MQTPPLEVQEKERERAYFNGIENQVTTPFEKLSADFQNVLVHPLVQQKVRLQRSK
jgi:hypothetical protein